MSSEEGKHILDPVLDAYITDGLNDEQKVIATTPEGMVRVDAGPGTGKTTTIVKRYARMVASRVDPRDILMVTFTKNAAEEMKERMRSVLKSTAEFADGHGIPNDYIEKSMGEIRTSTFDSLFLHIVYNNPSEINDFFDFDSKTMISRDAKMITSSVLNLQYFRSFYAKFLKKHGKTYKRRDVDYPALMANCVDELFNTIQKLMSRGIIPIKDDEWFGDGQERLEGDIDGLISILTKNRGDLESKINKNLETFGLSSEIVLTEELCKEVAKEDREWLIYFIHAVYYEYIRSSIIDNRLTFALTMVFAFAVLYQSDYARKFNSVDYMMIDEFQDTNEMQLMIVMMLLNKPNLCVVGDWKQGIYGFRFVSVENMVDFPNKVKQMISKLNTDQTRVRFRYCDEVNLPLKKNYRSSKEIVEYTFRALTVRGNEKEVVVNPFIQQLSAEADPGYGVHKRVECFKSDTSSDLEIIVNQITQYMYSGRYNIKDGDGFRQPRFSDISVLFRTSEKCRMLFDMLNTVGIPAFIQGDLQIMSSIPGKIALAWLRYVNDRDDKRGLATILMYENFSYSQIRHIMKDRKEIGEKAIPEYIVKEREFLLGARRRPNELLTAVFAFHDIGKDNFMEADMAQSIIRVISSEYDGSLMTLADIIRMMEDDIKHKTSYPVDVNLMRDAVTIQTMHKSKGLEYPMVIVGGIGRGSLPHNDTDKPKMFYRDLSGLRLTQKFVKSDGEPGEEFTGVAKSWKGELIRIASKENYDEERRLLFVALSRAKQYLTVTAPMLSSRFFEELCVEGYTDLPLYLEPEDAEESQYVETPEIPPYKPRRKNMAVHDLMTYVTAKDSRDKDRGKEYGNRVHIAAQMIAEGQKCTETLPEIPRIREIVDSLGDEVRIETERNCILPVGDAVIHGTIDLIAEYDDRIEIHDWKTDSDDRNLGSYVTQLSVYRLAVMKVKKKPVDCYVQYLSFNKTVKIEPMTEDQLLAKVEETLKTPAGTSSPQDGPKTIGA